MKTEMRKQNTNVIKIGDKFDLFGDYPTVSVKKKFEIRGVVDGDNYVCLTDEGKYNVHPIEWFNNLLDKNYLKKI